MDSYPRRGPAPSGEEAFDRILPFVPWAIAAFLVASLFAGAFYTVEPNEQAVLFRYGKYRGTTLPGLHVKIPLIDEVIKVNVAEHSLHLPYGTGESRTDMADPFRVQQVAQDGEEATLMLTGDLNTASVEWTMQWQVTAPDEYVIRFPQSENDAFAERLISNIARTVMNRLVGDHSFDEVIGARRSDLAADTRNDVQAVLDSFECGITITALQMQRVIPPSRVRPSFEQVNSSIQEKQKSENEGEAKRNQLLPEARAEMDQLIRQAEGYAARRRAEATGEIEALRVQAAAYLQAPEVTRRRLYLEAMEDVLKDSGAKTILDADLKQVLPILPLDADAQPAARAASRGDAR